MWFEAVSIGILVGLFRGGRLRNFENMHLKGTLLILLGMLIQMVPFFLHVIPWVLNNAVYFSAAGLVLALVALLMNLKKKGLVLVVVGTVSQLFVIVMNDFRMPIRLMNESAARLVQLRLAIESGEITNYVLFTDASHWSKWLGKLVIMPSAYPFTTAFGLPDVLIALGVIWFIQSELVGYRMYGRSRKLGKRRY